MNAENRVFSILRSSGFTSMSAHSSYPFVPGARDATRCAVRSGPFISTFTDQLCSVSGVAVTRAGAGLGLALVNRFVELHHGWVELESQPGQGTRVTCHLPRRAEPQRQTVS